MTDVVNQAQVSFANNFWGKDDAGYDVLKAKMNATKRTYDDLKAFYSVRASLHEEFGKKLLKHLKMDLGHDESGTIRVLLASAHRELEVTAQANLELAQKIRSTLELTLDNFILEQKDRRKLVQTNVEKAHRNKQLHAAHVAKAKEKYEVECAKHLSLKSQLTGASVRESDRLRQKLDRYSHEIKVLESEYRTACTKSADAVALWNSEWKIACDTYQEMEDKRMNFMHHSLSVYVNVLSTSSLQDQESFERFWKALEQCDPKSDLETFVKERGTGPMIPEPPVFVHYTDDPEKTLPTYQVANFSHPKSSQSTSPQLHSVRREPVPTVIQDEPATREPKPPKKPVSTAFRPSEARSSPTHETADADYRPASSSATRTKALPAITEERVARRPSTRKKNENQQTNMPNIPIIALPDSGPTPPSPSEDSDEEEQDERIDPRAKVVFAIGNNAFETDIQPESNAPVRRRKSRCSKKPDEALDISIQELLKELGIQQQGQPKQEKSKSKKPSVPTEPQATSYSQHRPPVSQYRSQPSHPPSSHAMTTQTHSVYSNAHEYQMSPMPNGYDAHHYGTLPQNAPYQQITYDYARSDPLQENVLAWGHALYDHHSADPNYLSFSKGTLLAVVRFDSDNWWLAHIYHEATHTLSEQYGLVASNYLAIQGASQ